MVNHIPKCFSIKTILILIAIGGGLAFAGLSHYLVGQQIRKFAIETTQVLKKSVCSAKYAAAHPCGNRNVQFEADSGLVAYIYIYGVVDSTEVAKLSEYIKSHRRSASYYRKIPVKVIFYTDLNRSAITTQFWLIKP